MTNVVLTGTGATRDAVVEALGEEGCNCWVVDTPGELPALAERLADEIDAFVQLPTTIVASADTAIGRVREFLTEGLLARFTSAEIAVGALRDGGRVVLVAGNSPGDRELSDDQRARYSLLRVLSHAIIADAKGRGITSVMLPNECTPAEIVDGVLGRTTSRDRVIAEFVDRDSDMSYADWRLELLSMVRSES